MGNIVHDTIKQLIEETGNKFILKEMSKRIIDLLARGRLSEEGAAGLQKTIEEKLKQEVRND